jgi:hypothetical protein
MAWRIGPIIVVLLVACSGANATIFGHSLDASIRAQADSSNTRPAPSGTEISAPIHAVCDPATATQKVSNAALANGPRWHWRVVDSQQSASMTKPAFVPNSGYTKADFDYPISPETNLLFDAAPGYWKVACEVTVTYSDATDTWNGTASVVVYFDSVGVDQLQFRNLAQELVEVSGPIYVTTGSSIDYRAIPIPSGSSWPSGQPKWGGTSGASGTGASATVVFDTVAASSNDVKSVTAQCGIGRASAGVICFAYRPVYTPDSNLPGHSRTGVGLGELIHLSVAVRPADLPSTIPVRWTWTLAGDNGFLDDYGDGTGMFMVGTSPGRIRLSVTGESEQLLSRTGLSATHPLRDVIQGDSPAFRDLKEQAEAIRAAWRRGDWAHSPNELLRLIRECRSDLIKDDTRLDFAHSLIVSSCREFGTSIQVDVMVEYMLELRRIDLSISDNTSEFATRRSADSLLFVQNWKAMVDAKDPNWDPTEHLYLNVPLPPGVSGISGMSPDGIADPVQRATYQAAIDRNAELEKRFMLQHEIRWKEKEYYPAIENYLIRAYSIAPDSRAELKQYLLDNIADGATCQRILYAVDARIGRAPTTKPSAAGGQ